MEAHDVADLEKLVSSARFETKRLQAQARKTSAALAKLSCELEARGIGFEVVPQDPSDTSTTQPRRAQS